MVVDDEPTMTLALSARLEAKGYEVVIASNGLEAIDKAKSEHPDLIITDVLMPELTGYEFVQRLKSAMEGGSEIPIIVMSGKYNMEDFFESWDIHGFIGKPFDFAELLVKVEEALHTSELSDSSFVQQRRLETREGVLVVTLGAEEFIMEKVEALLRENKCEVRHALDEADALKRAERDMPNLIVGQYWEDSYTLDLAKFYKGLMEKPTTAKIPFIPLCSNRIFNEAMKSFPPDKIIVYANSNELITKLEGALPEYLNSPEAE